MDKEDKIIRLIVPLAFVMATLVFSLMIAFANAEQAKMTASVGLTVDNCMSTCIAECNYLK